MKIGCKFCFSTFCLTIPQSTSGSTFSEPYRQEILCNRSCNAFMITALQESDFLQKRVSNITELEEKPTSLPAGARPGKSSAKVSRCLKSGSKLRVRDISPTHMHNLETSKEGERFPTSRSSLFLGHQHFSTVPKTRSTAAATCFPLSRTESPFSHLPQSQLPHRRVASPKHELFLLPQVCTHNLLSPPSPTQLLLVLFPQPPPNPQSNRVFKGCRHLRSSHFTQKVRSRGKSMFEEVGSFRGLISKPRRWNHQPSTMADRFAE